MPLVKPLCRVCERPTADGAVQAVQLDKEKLQTWLLNVCGYEFADGIEDEDLICFFCIWHAEFHSKYVSEFEALAWWPQDSVYLDGVAKELRRKYLEGKAEQCWVQLEKIELPKSEKEENAEPEENANDRECDYQNCATYFHTVEEKKSHTKEVHETSKAKKFIKCNFCEMKFRWSRDIRNHIRRVHSEFPVLCDSRGCLSYFKTEFDMKVHFDSTHKKEDEQKVFKCQYCEHKTSKNSHLTRHISRFHLPKTFKCDKCDKMLASKQLLARHVTRKISVQVSKRAYIFQ
ncbi:RE1-silencing transcription factor-like [Cloeon dipterum]|uniref:RE1-silencing transcription factor-like n=1 Tax=Cloeon dipterum TaxID=197152 RepID=UPI00321F9ABD